MEIHWDPVEEWLVIHGTRIALILVLGTVAWFGLQRIIRPMVHRSVASNAKDESAHGIEKRTDTLVKVFIGAGKAATVIIILIMVLEELGVPIGPMLAGLGVVGLAVGFGAQYLIRDLIAGSFIIMENQYRVGDWGQLNDTFGMVEEVNLRKTVLRDLDGIVHHIPNGTINIASNATRHFARVNLNVRVAYNTDLDHAISVINRVGQELAADEAWKSRVLTPPQVRRVNEFGDNGIEIKIVGDVDAGEQWGVAGELRLRLKRAFDAERIEMPWQYTKVFFDSSFDVVPVTK